MSAAIHSPSGFGPFFSPQAFCVGGIRRTLSAGTVGQFVASAGASPPSLLPAGRVPAFVPALPSGAGVSLGAA